MQAGADSDERVLRDLFAAEEPAERLGEILLRRGYVTRAQLDECLRAREGGVRLAQLLLQRGYVTTARLLEALAVADAAPGDVTRIGKYVVLRELARGGMGIVYEAEDSALKRRVALKVLRDVEATPNARERLRREAAIAAQLQHANIVAVHEVGAEDDAFGRPLHYIAMELVEGRTLAELIAEGRTAREDLLRMVEDVARAVAYAHSRGVIHRDLKPANVLVDSGGRVLLTDFGLARAEMFRTRLTQSQAIMGTPQYMAPEQVEGRREEIDARTDVYALGVMLYEVLTGRTPHVAETPPELYRRIVEEDPPPPSRLRRDVAQDLEVICLKAMAKERARRYASAVDLVADLGRFRRGEPVTARPASVFYRMRKVFLRHRAVLATIAVLVAASATVLLVLREKQKRIAEADRYRRMQEKLKPLEEVVRQARQFFYIRGEDIGQRLADVERALGELRKIADDPANAGYADPWTLQGIGWYVLGDSERAEEALARALERAPDDPWANYYLGRICLERSAAALFGPAGMSHRDALDRSRVWSERAQRYLGRPLPPGASTAEIDRCVADAYRALALRDVDGVRRRCDEGLSRFGNAIGTEEFWNLLGWVRSGRERLDAYERAIERRPHYPWAFFMHGLALEDTGDLAAAAVDYEKAVRLNPRFVEAWVNRCVALKRGGDLRAALAEFDRAIAANPRSAPLRHLRGLVRFELGDADGAIADYDEALQLDPRLARAYVDRGFARFKGGDVRAALEDYDRAVVVDATDPLALANRAVARQAAGNREGAIADFEEALRVAPREWPHRASVQRALEAARKP